MHFQFNLLEIYYFPPSSESWHIDQNDGVPSCLLCKESPADYPSSFGRNYLCPDDRDHDTDMQPVGRESPDQWQIAPFCPFSSLQTWSALHSKRVANYGIWGDDSFFEYLKSNDRVPKWSLVVLWLALDLYNVYDAYVIWNVELLHQVALQKHANGRSASVVVRQIKV